MHEKILVLDFGSQVTQLIARRLRELNVFGEIQPFHKEFDYTQYKGIILSGSPCSVNDEDAPDFDFEKVFDKIPVLGICYGAQLLAKNNEGIVDKSNKREYGRAHLHLLIKDPILEGIKEGTNVWMSHGDSIKHLPDTFETIAKTDGIPIAIFKRKHAIEQYPVYGFQFHPEVYHTEQGIELFRNFLFGICKCQGDWTPSSFVSEQIENLKTKLTDEKVILGLSGGVDSSVAALLLHRAIGKNLWGIFVNNGLLRKNEFSEVLQSYQHMGLQVKGVDASALFLKELNGVSDPETKRKIIGKLFIEVFEKEAKQLEGVKWLAQGTIYPDVIESVSVHGPSQTIKSHHNVGGLPEKLNLKIIEPLRALFKDEVRKVGKELNLDKEILNRHPFPGPGLAIRIMGEINHERVKILQDADAIYINHLKQSGWYDKVWQAGAILTNIKSVGVMGDERTYEQVLALRAVVSTDGMTADWSHLPYELLAKISNDIIRQVKGINRVVYDISSKPPATIEWE